jgi:DNA polymerase III psi subunit
MPVKEPRFFVPELRSRYWRPAASRRKRPHTLDGYRALFSGARPEQRIGEATPEYLRSREAARRIAEVAPDARIVAVLREPASFLRSLHLQAVHNYTETQKDFRKAIELEPARRAGKRVPRFSQSPKSLLYSDHVRYVEQLRGYHEAFGREQVLVLIYDDFRADNEATVRRVLRFLDVEDMPTIRQIDTEPLPVVRIQSLHQIARLVTIAKRSRAGARRPSRSADARRDPNARAGAWQRAWKRAVYRDSRPPDEELMLELRRRFKGEVTALSEYLGRDLVSLWGYDELG